MTPQTKVWPSLIIGAGISGLGAAEALGRRGILPLVVDEDARPGETWRRRHPQLQLNTHRVASALPGLEMPRSVGAYPHRDDVARYVGAYEKRLGADLRHGVRVERLSRANGLWRAETSDGALLARNVIVATGYDREPHIPPWPGLSAWSGQLVHAAGLGDVRQYAGKRVLVVGAGNSGCDVINHLVRVDTAGLMVSVRHGPSIIPKWIGPFPMMRLTPALAKIPTPILDPLVAGIARLMFGDLRRYGLTRHPLGLSRRLKSTGIAPAIDDGMVAAIRSGRVTVVPEIAHFCEDRIALADSRVVEPDVVIAATGYRTGLEPLVGHLHALDRDGTPLVNGGTELRHLPGLFFTGMKPGLTGFFLAAARTGAEIADRVAAREGEASRPTGTPARLRRRMRAPWRLDGDAGFSGRAAREPR